MLQLFYMKQKMRSYRNFYYQLLQPEMFNLNITKNNLNITKKLKCCHNSGTGHTEGLWSLSLEDFSHRWANISANIPNYSCSGKGDMDTVQQWISWWFFQVIIRKAICELSSKCLLSLHVLDAYPGFKGSS